MPAASDKPCEQGPPRRIAGSKRRRTNPASSTHPKPEGYGHAHANGTHEETKARADDPPSALGCKEAGPGRPAAPRRPPAPGQPGPRRRGTDRHRPGPTPQRVLQPRQPAEPPAAPGPGGAAAPAPSAWLPPGSRMAPAPAPPRPTCAGPARPRPRQAQRRPSARPPAARGRRGRRAGRSVGAAGRAAPAPGPLLPPGSCGCTTRPAARPRAPLPRCAHRGPAGPRARTAHPVPLPVAPPNKKRVLTGFKPRGGRHALWLLQTQPGAPQRPHARAALRAPRTPRTSWNGGLPAPPRAQQLDLNTGQHPRLFPFSNYQPTHSSLPPCRTHSHVCLVNRRFTKEENATGVNASPLSSVNILYLRWQNYSPAADRQHRRALQQPRVGPARQGLPSSSTPRFSAIASTGKPVRHMENSTDLFSRAVQLLETTKYQFPVCGDCRNISCPLKRV